MPPSSDAPVLAAGVDELAAEVAEGLTRSAKRLPSKYLYDALGSQLFEAICELPWYRITRGERALLARERATITAPLGNRASVIELGGGSGEKLAILVEALVERGARVETHLVDISPTALDLSARTLGGYPRVSIRCHAAAYLEGLGEAVREVDGDHPCLALFLGSNIGNLGPAESDRFLRAIRSRLRRGDMLLLGADLIKSEEDLILAYDDPLGVTAAFNANLLVRLNRELEADFDLAEFDYRAVWNAGASRVETYLVSRSEQTVCLPRAGCCVRLAAGEAIWTESSHKYERAEIADLGERAGFARREQWVEPESKFALTLFDVR